MTSNFRTIFRYKNPLNTNFRYSPQKVDIDYVLQPFIPEFIPAVGDIDAFLKVVPPKLTNEKRNVTEHIAKLGLDVLDEPSGQQSEPALLHMKLRSISTQPRTPGGAANGSGTLGTGTQSAPPPPSVSKSSKDIEKWINEIQNLHVQQPFPLITQKLKPVQDIDALMNEWPPDMERTLNNLGFPNAFLNCTLPFYVELICSLLDIGMPSVKGQSDYILALATLFNLYMAVKNSV